MYIVGGMPEAVDAYIKTQSFAEVRAVHREILEGYERECMLLFVSSRSLTFRICFEGGDFAIPLLTCWSTF